MLGPPHANGPGANKVYSMATEQPNCLKIFKFVSFWPKHKFQFLLFFVSYGRTVTVFNNVAWRDLILIGYF